MSVKFEKETIKQTAGVAGAQGIATMAGGKHPLATEIGTALTGGKASVGQRGYLAVSYPNSACLTTHSDILNRLTSSNSKRTLCGQRCLRLERCPVFKNSSPLGSLRIGTYMATTLHREYLRWPCMELSLVLLLATFSLASSRECLPAEPA